MAARVQAERARSAVDLAPLLEAARAQQPRMVALRRAIHADPEIGLETPRTRTKLIEALADCDLELERHERTSGLVAILRGRAPSRPPDRGARASDRPRRSSLRLRIR